MHQTLNWSAYQARTMLDTNSTVAHHLIASLIRTIYLMITKHPQNGSLKSLSTLLLAAGQQRKLMKTQFGQQWRVFTNFFCSCSQHGKFLQFCSRTQQGKGIVETTLILGSPMEARKVPVCGFLQSANTNWHSLWKRWLPDFAWHLVQGACAGTRS